MARDQQAKKQEGQVVGQVQDFSARYKGGEQVQAAQGEWFTFEEPGDELVGIYQGMEPFRNGVKGSIVTADGPTVFSVGKLLRQQLDQIAKGTRIAIVLAGFQASDKQSPMKVFQVFKVRA